MERIIQRNWFLSISIAVLLLSFWLRWSGLSWQLPDTRFGDEEHIIRMTHRISLHHDPLIIRSKLGFWYCPAYNYLSLIVFKISDQVVVSTGLFPSHDLIPVWTHYLLGRTLSMLMSIGTIAVLMFMFKNVFGKLTALLAGVFLALNPVDLFRANIANSDTMAMLLGTLTLYLAFKLMTTKGWTLYLLSGAVYGAALASKLFTLGFFVPLVVGHVLAQTGDKLLSRLRNAVRDWRWLILPIAALGGYAIANPQSFLAAGAFLKDIQTGLISGYMGGENWTLKTAAELIDRLKNIYSNLLAPTPGFSFFALALALIGSIVLFIRRFRLGLMMLVTFISVNIFLLPTTVTYGRAHHYLVVVPICALLIGTALNALWEQVIRIRLVIFRLLLCGIIIMAAAFAVSEMFDNAIRVSNSKTGEGILSRRTDFRKWMIDNIPPGSRVAYDRYGTDLIPGYFDVVKKPGYEKGMDYYSNNFDYVIVSWDRINDYKVYQELFKREPMAIFEGSPFKTEIGMVSFKTRLAIYKMDRDESKHARMKNFYTETLPRKMGIESTFSDPSFENGDLLESWGVRLFQPYRAWKPKEWWGWEETYRPDGKNIEWWDGKDYLPHFEIEKVSDIRSDGKFSLHIMLAEERPMESIESAPLAKDKRLQIGQVIPYDFLDWLQYFSLDYYLGCNPAQDKPPGSIKLHFIAESIGGQYLNIETYVLYDSNEVQNPICGKWQTFKRNIKADFNKPFVRWKDIEFMIFFVEVENSEYGSLDIYIDNILTAETLVLRKFLNDPDRNK